MKPQVISIDGVDYVRRDSIPVQAPVDKDIKICVLDRGFVYVGKATIKDDFLVIEYAHNIRVWGTTKGLGELVQGPTKDTKLDKVGTVNVPMRAVISIINTEEGKWKLL